MKLGGHWGRDGKFAAGAAIVSVSTERYEHGENEPEGRSASRICVSGWLEHAYTS